MAFVMKVECHMLYNQLKKLLLGEPISTHMAEEEKISKKKALAVLSSDALSSVAYATEEILIPLAAFSVAAVAWSIPIALGIGLLLVILTASYRQTIDSYPGGGGAYIVAKENLGAIYGLIAAASLLIDYVLTVSVSVASGVENIVSAYPPLGAHKEAAGALIILFMTLFNLRGVRASANLFAIPTMPPKELALENALAIAPTKPKALRIPLQFDLFQEVL